MKRNINTLISEVTGIIRAYASDAGSGEGERWITLSNGAHVQIDGEGTILKGMGGKFDGQKVDDLSEDLYSKQGNYTMLPNGETVLVDLEGKKVIGGVPEEHIGKPIFEYIQAKQDEAEAAARKKEEAKKSKSSESQADAIDKKSYGGYDMHKSDRELNTEAYDKHNGDEKKVKAEQLKISKQRDKYVDDNVKMFERVGSERGWEGTDVSRSRQSMSTYVTLQKDGYEPIEIRFSDHEDRHNSNTIDLMSGSTAKENKQRLSAFLDRQKPLGAEDAKVQGSDKSVRQLITDCHRVIRAYAADEAEEWITLKNGSHVLVGEGGEIKAGLGGEHEGENVQKLGQGKQSKSAKTKSISSTPSKPFSEDLKEQDGNHVKAAQAFYRREFQGKHVVASFGDLGEKDVEFTSEGIHEIRNRMRDNPIKAQIVPKIPEIIQKGEYLGKEKPYKDKPKDQKENTIYHYFKGNVEINGKKINAIVDVKERDSGRYEYSLYNLNYEGYPTWSAKTKNMNPQKTKTEDTFPGSRVLIAGQQKVSSDANIISENDSIFNIYIVG